MDKQLIAKWQTRGGKHYAELYKHTDGAYTYSGNGCGGCLGVLASDTAAIQNMEARLWYMVPDNNKTGMTRVV